MKSFVNTPVYYIRQWLFILLASWSTAAFAQKKEFILTGVTFKKTISASRVANVLVANLANNAISITDDLGSFRIKCSIGDTLLFKQKDYTDLKVAIINESDLMVSLQPVINLFTVNIRDVSKKQELQQIMNDYSKQGVYNNGKPQLLSVLKSPLNGLFDFFGSGPKRARRFQQYSARELEQMEVDRRFTKTLVAQTTGYEGNKLQKFVEQYKPAYEDIKKWNSYDLISYIKKSYKDYEQNGDRPGLQKLY